MREAVMFLAACPAVVFSVFSTSGCTARIGDPQAGESRDGGGGAFGEGNVPAECVDAVPAVSRGPLRRLSHFEWNNTVRDLFANLSIPRRTFVPDNRAHGFENNAEVLVPSPLLVEQYQTAALEITEIAVERFVAARVVWGAHESPNGTERGRLSWGLDPFADGA